METRAEKAQVKLEFDAESDPRRALYASHFRAGEWAEARAVALEGHAAASDPDELLAWSSNLGNVERKDGNPRHALTIHKLAAPLLSEARNPLVIAKYHHTRGNTHLDLGDTDSALVEFDAALYFYTEANAGRYCAMILNNIAVVKTVTGQTAEAHDHLDRAEGIYKFVGDPYRLAEIDDTRAKVFLAESDADRAESYAARSLSVLAASDEKAARDETRKTLIRAWDMECPTWRADALLDEVRARGFRAVIDLRASQIEQDILRAALSESGGSVTATASLLGISRQGLEQRLERFPDLLPLVVRRGAK